MTTNKIPTTTVHQSRLQVFQPTRLPKDCIRNIQTSWGRAIIDGKLGQVHADIVEAIFYYAATTEKLDDGRVVITVDPYKIKMSVGGGKAYSYPTINKRIDEIMKALIKLDIAVTGQKVTAHIIDRVMKSKIMLHNPIDSTVGDKRHMWEVVISNEFMELIREDLPIHYDPLPLAQLETGIAQAVARHVLTHKNEPNGGWIIDNILGSVGVDMTKNAAVRKRRFELSADSKNLENLGIILDGKKIRKA
jgi:hypothetical protein